MIIALAQLNYHIGDFEKNTAKIVQTIKRAKEQGADLIVFAELAIGGYAAKDLFRYKAFLDDCEKHVALIARECIGIACVIGGPVRNVEGYSKSLSNAAFFMAEGKVQHIVRKTLLPDYDVFDEYRYFEPNKHFGCITFEGKKIAVTICEDLWGPLQPHLYGVDPLKELAKEGPDFVVNIAASPFSLGHYETRLSVLLPQAKDYGLPMFYVNQVGAHTDIIYDGRSLVIDAAGEVAGTLAAFKEELRFYSLDEGGKISAKGNYSPYKEPSEEALIHDALVLGIRDFFQKSGFSKAILGLSGGIDSAVVASLACEALGAENVMAVLMPSVYSTDHSLKDALDLVRNTGCMHEVIPIKTVAAAFDDILSEAFRGKSPDITEENIQARCRAVILMAMSNKHGYILLNTSNKSEAAVGYGTLYGDMAGALGIIGDVLKTKVYALARYINREREIIPINTMTKAPSAELRHDQKDSDSLPEYDILDAILTFYVEYERSGEEIKLMGFDKDVVERVISLVNGAEFKRFQTPPILRVTRKSFGAGRMMPLVARTSR
ncbi:NAD+ synthase [Olivibacter sitiensis]|uniref:NAD+ synthase n=1 Tax=Olivibacter sitiensis TaxID=376470 RepID=UPI0004888CA7|nr:NAD+ synthase [Olivibacter sitiensis]